MIFAKSEYEYYFKYYDPYSERVYESRYSKLDVDLRQKIPNYIFEAMIEWCLDTESYEIRIDGHYLICIFNLEK